MHQSGISVNRIKRTSPGPYDQDGAKERRSQWTIVAIWRIMGATMATVTLDDLIAEGSKRTASRAAQTPLELIGRIRAGLPVRTLEELLSRLGIDAKEASAVLGIAPRTLSRKRNGAARLSPAESDRVARVARIFAAAVSALGDEERARGWLGDRNRALGGVRPLELLDTEIGAREVENVLGRIAYGVYS